MPSGTGIRVSEAFVTMRPDFGTFGAEVLAGTSRTLDSLGGDFMRAGGALTAGLTLPIAGAGAASVKMALDFESSFAGIRKTMDLTEDEFGRLAAANRDLAREIPVSVDELNRIGELAGQLGIRGVENVREYEETIASLAVTTNLTAESASLSIAQIINIMQLAQSESDNLGSSVVQLGNNFATTEDRIVDYMLRIAGAGELSNLTAGDVAGISTAFSSLGIEAEAGGTAVQKVLIAMLTAATQGGRELTVFARTAGVSAEEFRRMFEEDAAGAFISFVEGLGTQGNRAVNTLEQLGLTDQRLTRAFLGAAGAGDLLTRAVEQGNIAYDENIALSEEAAKRFATRASQIRTSLNRLRDEAIEFGLALGPVIDTAIALADPLTDGLGAAVDLFAALPTPVQASVVALAGLTAAAGPALFLVGGMATGVSALIALLPTKTAATSADTVATTAQAAATAQLNAYLAAELAASTGVTRSLATQQAARARLTTQIAAQTAATAASTTVGGAAGAASTSALLPGIATGLGAVGLALGTVGVIAEGIFRQTTGHGLIEWVFGDPQQADAIEASVKRVRLEIEAAAAAGIDVRPIEAYRDEVDNLAQAWLGGSEAWRAWRDQIEGGASPLTVGNQWAGQTEEASNALASFTAQVEAMMGAVAAGQLPLTQVMALVNAQPEDFRRAAMGVEGYAAAANKANAAYAASEQAALGASRGALEYGEAASAAVPPVQTLDERTAELAQQLSQLGPEAAASAAALKIMAIQADESIPAFMRGALAVQAFVRGISDVREAQALQEEYEGLLNTIMGLGGAWSAPGGGGGGVAGGMKTRADELAESFDQLAERAPRALRAAKDTLDDYRDAAEAAGDATALRLIDQLLQVDPTVSQIEGAISSLQAQYGDLGAAARESADIQAEAAKIAADAWATLEQRATSDLDKLGDALTTGLRRQLDEQLRLTLVGLDDQRDAVRASYDRRLEDLRAHTARLIAPLNDELQAIDRAQVQDELAAIEAEIALAWDPRKRADLEERRVEIMRRIRQGELRDQISDLQDAQRDREADERRRMDARLAALDDETEATRARYAAMSAAWVLESQARTLVLNGEVDTITAILDDAVPEWGRKWQSFGADVIHGPLTDIEAKVRGIVSLMGQLGGGSARPSSSGTAASGAPAGADPAMADYIAWIAREQAQGAPAFVVDRLRDQFEDLFDVKSPLERGGVFRKGQTGLGFFEGFHDEIASPVPVMEDTIRRVLRQEGGGGRVIELHNYTVLDGEVIDHRVERIVADATRQAAGRGRYGA